MCGCWSILSGDAFQPQECRLQYLPPRLHDPAQAGQQTAKFPAAQRTHSGKALRNSTPALLNLQSGISIHAAVFLSGPQGRRTGVLTIALVISLLAIASKLLGCGLGAASQVSCVHRPMGTTGKLMCEGRVGSWYTVFSAVTRWV